MSYADDLAKDRDKYRTQRNKLIDHLEVLMVVLRADNDRGTAAIRAARKDLKKIYSAEPSIEKLLGI